MKTAIVTGTSRGIGYELSKFLLEKDYFVLGISRTGNDIQHPNYTHQNLDVRDTVKIDNLIKQLECNIDLFINNAGVFRQGPIENFLNEDIGLLMDTNLISPMHITKSVIPKLSPGSQIVYINSVAGLYNFQNQSVYCASQHALKSFAKILGKELRPKQVRVCSLHLGGVNTTFYGEYNPYPFGDITKAVEVKELNRALELIINTPDWIDMSSIELFPMIEWHG